MSPRGLIFSCAGPSAPAAEEANEPQKAYRHRYRVRQELDGERVLLEERLLEGKLGRIRDVRVGPDGLVYLLTDSDNGRLLRLEPK